MIFVVGRAASAGGRDAASHTAFFSIKNVVIRMRIAGDIKQEVGSLNHAVRGGMAHSVKRKPGMSRRRGVKLRQAMAKRDWELGWQRRRR